MLLKKYQLADDALQQIAMIMRGADTDRFDLAPLAAGLRAISSGLSYNIQNDHEMLKVGMVLYNALYSWSKYVSDEKYTWNPDVV